MAYKCTMLNNLSNNLNMLMAQARLNSSELARQIGLPATTIKRIRNNEHANPTITTLLPIAKFFSITINELLGSELLNIEGKSFSITGLKKIPLLSWQECVNYESLEYDQCPNYILTERQLSKKAFALAMDDDNSEFFPKYCILILDPEEKPNSGDYIVVAKKEQTLAFVRKYLIEIDQIYLKPLVLGLNVSPLTSEYKILGVIVQYKMELKTERS
jgi:transcriptional regulator with XRE-family HTH domain